MRNSHRQLTSNLLAVSLLGSYRLSSGLLTGLRDFESSAFESANGESLKGDESSLSDVQVVAFKLGRGLQNANFKNEILKLEHGNRTCEQN